jgi:hypothetical protein
MHTLSCCLVLLLSAGVAGVAGAQSPAPTAVPAPQPPPGQPAASPTPSTTPPPAIEPSTVSDKAHYLFDSQRIHNDPEILWPGFLNGLRGFEHFHNPIGNPLYFEPPTNETMARFIYIHHDFPDDSQVGGGTLDIAALQIRLAITERISFIAVKDGYSWLDADAVPDQEGWNDIAVGMKYTFFADQEMDLLAAFGSRIEFDSGEESILQGDDTELAPFLSVAKGLDRLHTIAAVTGRIPVGDNSDDYNNILQWDLHVDYDVAPEVLPGLAPVIEVHGLHYLSDGEHLPLNVGGLDYANFGSTNVEDSVVVWLEAGARWELSPHASVGVVYGYPLTNRDADIFGDRVTLDFILKW